MTLEVSAGSAAHVVELGFRRIDVLPTAVPDRPQRAPAEVEQRSERFGIEQALDRFGAGQRAGKIDSIGVHRGHVERIHDGGDDIHETHGAIDPRARLDAGPGDDEGHVQRGVVHEHAV